MTTQHQHEYRNIPRRLSSDEKLFELNTTRISTSQKYDDSLEHFQMNTRKINKELCMISDDPDTLCTIESLVKVYKLKCIQLDTANKFIVAYSSEYGYSPIKICRSANAIKEKLEELKFKLKKLGHVLMDDIDDMTRKVANLGI